MKKIVLVTFFLLAFSTQANASIGGWLLGKATDVGTSYAGAKLAGAGKGGVCIQNEVIDVNDHTYIANSHLWSMHLIKSYTKNYKFYLDYLEKNAQNFKQWDTVAVVYFENKEGKKALEIYEKHVMPWIVGVDNKNIFHYKNTYEQIKKEVSCIFCGDKEFDEKIDVEEVLKEEKRLKEALKMEDIREEREQE